MSARVFASLLIEERDFQVMQAADARRIGARHGLEVEVAFAATVIAPSNAGPAIGWVAPRLENGEHPPREVIMNPTSHPPVAELQPWGAW